MINHKGRKGILPAFFYPFETMKPYSPILVKQL
jgi:hypothetical protein